jgi:hypothetical protein
LLRCLAVAVAASISLPLFQSRCRCLSVAVALSASAVRWRCSSLRASSVRCPLLSAVVVAVGLRPLSLSATSAVRPLSEGSADLL